MTHMMGCKATQEVWLNIYSPSSLYEYDKIN